MLVIRKEHSILGFIVGFPDSGKPHFRNWISGSGFSALSFAVWGSLLNATLKGLPLGAAGGGGGVPGLRA